jgi:hypothetical protein
VEDGFQKNTDYDLEDTTLELHEMPGDDCRTDEDGEEVNTEDPDENKNILPDGGTAFANQGLMDGHQG